MPDPKRPEAASSVQELLQDHDESFVRRAYQTLLGRSPDAQGLAVYLAQLRDGVPKAELVVALARSNEARPRQLQLAGLDELLRRHRQRPFRRLRRLLARVLLDGGGTAEQEVQALRNELDVAHHRTMQQIQATQEAVQALSALTQSLFARVLGSLDGVRAAPAAERVLPPVLGAGSTGRVVLNLSTSLQWRAPPCGAVRREREVARWMCGRPDVVFVGWDAARQALVALPDVEVQEILHERWCRPDTPVASFEWLRTPHEMRATDVYVSLGLDREHSPLGKLGPLLERAGCRRVLACDDVGALALPEWSASDEAADRLRLHTLDAARLADVVVTSSRHAAAGLVAFWTREAPGAAVPQVVTLAPAALPLPDAPLPLDADEAARLRALQAGGPYVLYAGAVAPRKNHRLLVHLWRELHREREARCPTLVFAGRAGAGVQDLLAQLQRMPAQAAGRIVVLGEVSDALLAELYRGCAFCVLPAHREDAAVQVAEALGSGKVCLVASDGGAPEAAPGLMPELHPGDHPGWKAAIEALLDQPDRLAELESRIAGACPPRRWETVGEELAAVLRALQQAPAGSTAARAPASAPAADTAAATAATEG